MSDITDFLIDRAIKKEQNKDVINGLLMAKEIVNESGCFTYDDIAEMETNDQIEDIASWMIKNGTQNTDNGNWHISHSEIAEKFGLTIEWIEKYHDYIIDELDERDEILSEAWDDEEDGKVVGFDLNFALKYCEKWDGSDDWGAEIL